MGLCWIPLRHLEQAGIPGFWAVAMVLLAAFIPAMVVTIWKREVCELTYASGWLVGFALGLATVLYFTAVLYTDVIRAIFLFYLLQLWTTLSARVLHGERIHREQVLVILATLFGVWLLLGGGSALPIPNNLGDWCAIASGFFWDVSLSLLRSKQDIPAFAGTTRLMALTDYLGFDIQGANQAFFEWKKHKKAGIMTFLDHGYISALTGTMLPAHHTPWKDALDDSLKSCLQKG